MGVNGALEAGVTRGRPLGAGRARAAAGQVSTVQQRGGLRAGGRGAGTFPFFPEEHLKVTPARHQEGAHVGRSRDQPEADPAGGPKPCLKRPHFSQRRAEERDPCGDGAGHSVGRCWLWRRRQKARPGRPREQSVTRRCPTPAAELGDG